MDPLAIQLLENLASPISSSSSSLNEENSSSDDEFTLLAHQLLANKNENRPKVIDYEDIIHQYSDEEVCFDKFIPQTTCTLVITHFSSISFAGTFD